MTQLKDLKKRWMENPEFRAEYAAQEKEFTLAAAMIEARVKAGMTQEQVAAAMGTTQSFIARLEGSGSVPSTKTLKRFAEATGMRLRISFEPEGRPSDRS